MLLLLVRVVPTNMLLLLVLLELVVVWLVCFAVTGARGSCKEGLLISTEGLVRVMGSLTVKVQPVPSPWEKTAMVPPWRSQMPLLMKRPRPLPPPPCN